MTRETGRVTRCKTRAAPLVWYGSQQYDACVAWPFGERESCAVSHHPSVTVMAVEQVQVQVKQRAHRLCAVGMINLRALRFTLKEWYNTFGPRVEDNLLEKITLLLALSSFNSKRGG